MSDEFTDLRVALYKLKAQAHATAAVAISVRDNGYYDDCRAIAEHAQAMINDLPARRLRLPKPAGPCAYLYSKTRDDASPAA